MLGRVARAAFKPLYHAHYRWLYGRRFPGSAWLERAVARWERTWERRDVPVSAARWNEEYERGVWDFLDGAGERVRYETIAEAVASGGDLGAVLDIGCGEGILLDFLPQALHSRYVGVDLSTVAIERASARRPGVRFEVADAETWEPPPDCSVVVLNECICYFRSPEAAIERYLTCIAPGGRLIVSVIDSLRVRAILSRFDRRHGFTSRRRIVAGELTWHLATIAADS